MSSILDTVTGGGLLPHVYCKKITLESAGESDTTNITLNLELYQSVEELSKSSWLNAFGDGQNQFLDSMFIQILQYKKTNVVEKLKPSYRSNTVSTDVNIYTAKEKIGDGFLPRTYAETNDGQSIFANDGLFTWGPGGFENPFRRDKLGDAQGNLVFKAEPAIQISVSSLLGNLTKKDVLLKLAAEGKVREEIIKGKAYYVIPFEYKCENFYEKGNFNNLGFVFYTFLDVPYFLELIDADYEVQAEFFEDFIVEGPINAEVVYLNGKATTKREAFFLPNGQAWEGSVHHHGPDNPDPDGYQGDGGLSGLNPAAPYTGWMVGERHQPGVDQPKLRLASVHNNKISDFRSSFQQSNLEEHSLDDEQNFNEDILIAQGGEQKFAGPGNTFLLPFQKERKVHLLKGASISKTGKLVGSSNDSEYSKLYVTRDIDNNARGVFFINFRNLLENNSNLYPLLFDAKNQNNDIVEPLRQQIMSYGRLLEIRLYRDRVDRHVLNTKYEEYLNDGPYEEPSKLIGSIGDSSAYQTPNQNNALTEITLSYNSETSNNPFIERYFMFTDKEVGQKTAGLYRYRVELAFKDGTYEFLYEMLKECARMRVLLDDYYDLAVSGENIHSGDFSFDANMTPEAYKKANFTPYFQDGAFSAQFLIRANDRFPDGSRPWQEAPLLIKEIFDIFGTYANFDPEVLINALDPGSPTGSPRGISYFMRLLSTCTKKLQQILGTTSLNKSGSELDNSTVPNGYNLNSQLDFVVSPSEETIYEDHTFDSPSELFEAVMNKDVYMDYLSIGAPMTAGFDGLRKISPIYYKDRAQLDAAKFSPLAFSSNAFAGPGSVTYKNETIDSNIAVSDTGADYLSNAAYSYLTPSVVEFSDPSEQNKSFNFYYTAFTVFARASLTQGTTDESQIQSNLFSNLENYEKILISLLNYNKNKENYIDADTTNPYFKTVADDALTERMESRNAYKRLIEQTGLTLYDPATYSAFFNKDPGASKEKIGNIDIGENYPLELVDFSDNDLYLDEYLKSYTPAMTAGPPLPALKPYPYSTSLPNSFKYYWLDQWRRAKGQASALNTMMNQAYGSYAGLGANLLVDNDYGPMFFFNTNLTAKIEAFRGSDFPKNDEDSWSLLTIGDIGAAQGGASSRFLCRVVLYDERFSQTVKVPIVDKYFLLDAGAVHLNPAPPAPAPEHESPRDWEVHNYERIDDFRTMTEKGIRDASVRDPLRPPPIEPDPNPRAKRVRAKVPDPRGRTPENEKDAGRNLKYADGPESQTSDVSYVEQLDAPSVTDGDMGSPPSGPGRTLTSPARSTDGSY